MIAEASHSWYGMGAILVLFLAVCLLGGILVRPIEDREVQQATLYLLVLIGLLLLFPITPVAVDSHSELHSNEEPESFEIKSYEYDEYGEKITIMVENTSVEKISIYSNGDNRVQDSAERLEEGDSIEFELQDERRFVLVAEDTNGNKIEQIEIRNQRDSNREIPVADLF